MTGTSDPYTIQPVITQIAFTTAPQTVVAGEVSGVMTIQTQDVTSNPLVVDADTTVNLTSTSGAGLFSLLADPWSDVTSVVIPIGQDSVSFYYKDTVAATPTITAAEDPDVGWTDATQQQTIVPGPPALVVITDPTDDTDVDANVASIIIEAMVTDIYGNRVADNTFVSWTPADYGGGNEGTPSEGTIDRTTTTIDGITSATLITSTIAGDNYIVQASAGDATGISPVITVVGTVTIDPPDYIDAGDVPDDNGGWIYITYTLSTNDPFHSAAAGPAINYYVVERSTTPPPEPPDGYAYQAFAFINLYDPEDDDDASVVLEVPVTNELHNYRIAAVYNPSTSVSSVLGENSDGESDGPTIVYVGELAAEESGIQSEWVNCGDIAGADNLDAYTDMTVLLEGAVSGDAMTAMPEGVVPTTSPYTDGATVEAVPDGVVDWIYIELRESETGPAVKEASAFVTTDGSVVNLTGERALPFRYTTGKSYYIVIRHRNHLPIMVNGAQTFGDVVDAATTIDVTTDGSAYGTDPLKQVGDKWAMYAGDVTQDGEITTADYETWYNAFIAGDSGYEVSDINLDGEVTTADYEIWYNNFIAGASSQLP
jgi:hypothetical protein